MIMKFCGFRTDVKGSLGNPEDTEEMLGFPSYVDEILEIQCM